MGYDDNDELRDSLLSGIVDDWLEDEWSETGSGTTQGQREAYQYLDDYCGGWSDDYYGGWSGTPEVGTRSSSSSSDDAPTTGCVVATLALIGGGLAVLAEVGYQVVRWLV